MKSKAILKWLKDNNATLICREGGYIITCKESMSSANLCESGPSLSAVVEKTQSQIEYYQEMVRKQQVKEVVDPIMSEMIKNLAPWQKIALQQLKPNPAMNIDSGETNEIPIP